MANESVVAFAPSTYQDNSAFEFDQVKKQEISRPHLGSVNFNSQEELIEKISKYYSIDEIARYLKQEIKDDEGKSSLKFRRITLQYPDSLICDSATIVHELQHRLGLTYQGHTADNTNESCCNSNNSCSQAICKDNKTSSQKLWILADTSYSPCCIDEVASQHVQSDLVIHFGDACLNIIEKLPAVYIFGKPSVDIDKLVFQFKERYPIEQNSESKILLMADSPHTYHLHNLYELLKPNYPNLVYADLYLDPTSNATIIGYSPHASSSAKLNVLNRAIIGLQETNIEAEEVESLLSEHDLFHITIPETPRLLQLSTRFQSVTTYNTESEVSSQGPYPNLMRRYRYIHMARSAGTVGLLVNTLSLANTNRLINNIGKKIKEAGKKHYIFVVGKPNVAKLANFENIDIWCILGCDHQGIIIDQNNEYFKPIITPYELLLALSDELTWTGKWVTDFNRILQDTDTDDGIEGQKENYETKNSNADYEDEAPEFNPVTGKYVSTSRPLRKLQHLRITSQEDTSTEDNTESMGLAKKFSSTIAIKNTVSTSAMHLQNRHWTGLGSDFNDVSDENEDGALVEDGRGGIARGYDYDREIHR